jgi:hypothetical protein
MIESLDTIRALGLAPVFEELYFGRADSAALLFSLTYPGEFHDLNLEDWEPLTAGGLVPLCSDGNFYDIYLYDPARRKFVVKFLEEPRRVKREFDNWQQFLASKLLEAAESGPTDEELKAAAELMGFKHTAGLLSLLGRAEGLPGSEPGRAEEDFVRACTA